MFAARSAHVAQLVEPALARGDWVLCDRFTDASRAYQGGGRGVDTRIIEDLARMAHPGLTPDLTLLLDLPPETGLQRARGRGDAGDRFEDEALAFFARAYGRATWTLQQTSHSASVCWMQHRLPRRCCSRPW